MWYEQSAQMMEGKGGVMEGKGRGVLWAAPVAGPGVSAKAVRALQRCSRSWGVVISFRTRPSWQRSDTSGYCRYTVGVRHSRSVSPHWGPKGPSFEWLVAGGVF